MGYPTRVHPAECSEVISGRRGSGLLWFPSRSPQAPSNVNSSTMLRLLLIFSCARSHRHFHYANVAQSILPENK
jgi:hypothetical protein